MAIITKPKGPSSHWYHKDGTPQHRMALSDGEGTRPTHLGDARKLGLYPSVSNIVGLLDKPGLSKWKVAQAILACLRTPRNKTETDKYYIDRVTDAAYQQVDDAAELGTAIHHEIERFLRFDWSTGPFVPGKVTVNQKEYDLGTYVRPVIDWMVAKQIKVENPEKVIVNPHHGYAGTTDAPYRAPKSFGILDYKSRKTEEGKEIEPWPEQVLQIAAYFVAYWGEAALDNPMAWGGNVYISSTEPGRVQIVMYPRAQLRLAWETFKALCAIWRFLNRFDPRVDPTQQPVWPDAVVQEIANPGKLNFNPPADPNGSADTRNAPVSNSAPASGPSSVASKPTTKPDDSNATQVINRKDLEALKDKTMLDLLNGARCKEDCDGMEFLSPADCAAFTPGKIKTIYSWWYHKDTNCGKVGLRNDAALREHGWMNCFLAYPKDINHAERTEGKADPVVGTNGLPVKPAPTPPPPPAPATPPPTTSKPTHARLKELEAMTMGFGKHAKDTLEKVPSHYLDWVRGQLNKKDSNIPAHVREYLARPDVNKAIDQDLKRKDRK